MKKEYECFQTNPQTVYRMKDQGKESLRNFFLTAEVRPSASQTLLGSSGHQQSSVSPSDITISIPLPDFGIKSIIPSILQSMSAAQIILNTNHSIINAPGEQWQTFYCAQQVQSQ